MPAPAKAVLLLAVLAASCGKTATVHLKGGEQVEAWIVRSEGGQVYLLPNGQVEERIVARSEIDDIDHPGNVHLGVGTTLAVLGAAGIAAGILVGSDSTEDSGDYKFSMYGLLPAGGALALVGGGLAVWGVHIYSKSRDASRSQLATGTGQLYPLVARTERTTFWGLGYGFLW